MPRRWSPRSGSRADALPPTKASGISDLPPRSVEGRAAEGRDASGDFPDKSADFRAAREVAPRVLCSKRYGGLLMVFKRVSWFMTLAALVWAVPASAQQPRAEISLLVGWVLSDGVDGDPLVDGRRRNLRPDRPEGLRQVGPDGWRAARRLRQRGSRVHVWPADESDGVRRHYRRLELGDWTINNYHGYFAYNFFEDDANGPAVHPWRPRRHQLRERRLHATQRRGRAQSMARRSSPRRGEPA